MKTHPIPKIDKGIPVPSPQRGKTSKYPYRDMLVGDSFFTTRDQSSIGSTAKAYGNRNRMKFTTRVVVENGVKGTRVWRVA